VIIVDTRVDADALTEAGASITTFIGSDNVDGGRIAGRFVADALGGQGRVAVVEGIPGHETGDSRLQGFREAIAEYPGMTIVASQTANWERDQAFNVTQNMLQSHSDLQAIFAANDVMALGALQQLLLAGAAVPSEVAIVGYDDIDFAAAAAVPLTSVRQPRERLGRTATELLIEETTEPGHEHHGVAFVPELMVRDSTRGKRTA
jgi:ABC-type sugar transport system substrate-binding protein